MSQPESVSAQGLSQSGNPRPKRRRPGNRGKQRMSSALLPLETSGKKAQAPGWVSGHGKEEVYSAATNGHPTQARPSKDPCSQILNMSWVCHHRAPPGPFAGRWKGRREE